MLFREFWNRFANVCLSYFDRSVIMRPGFMLALYYLGEKFHLISKVRSQPREFIHSFRDNEQDPSFTIPYFLEHLQILETYLVDLQERELCVNFRVSISNLVIDHQDE